MEGLDNLTTRLMISENNSINVNSLSELDTFKRIWENRMVYSSEIENLEKLSA